LGNTLLFDYYSLLVEGAAKAIYHYRYYDGLIGLDKVGCPLTNGFPWGGSTLWKGNQPTVLKGNPYILYIFCLDLSMDFLALLSPSAADLYRSYIGENLPACMVSVAAT